MIHLLLDSGDASYIRGGGGDGGGNYHPPSNGYNTSPSKRYLPIKPK